MDTTVIDRIKILGLDGKIRKKTNIQPFGYYTFSSQSASAAEQFHIFACLAMEAAQLAGITDATIPLEDDDPNSTITMILDAARQLGISVDFSPNKLKQGFGEYVIYVLDKLTEKAMANVNFVWNNVEINKENDDTDDEIDDNLGNVDEEMPGEELPEEAYTDDSENDVYESNMDESDNNHLAVNKFVNFDEEAWKQEVERAGAALTIRVAPTARDWRNHLSQLKTFKEDLSTISKSVKEDLNRSCSKALTVQEAANSRDALLAERLPSPLSRLAQLKAQVETITLSHKNVSGGVTQRQELLNSLTEKVESVKQKTEMKGTTMSDNSPIVNIKRAIVSLRKEIQQMNLQLAVLMWCVIDRQTRVHKNAPQIKI